MSKSTVAHFSASITIPADIAILTLIAGLFAYTLFSPTHNVFVQIEERHVALAGIAVIGWICGIGALLCVLAQLRQVFFDDRRAVWIEHGKVVFLDKHYFLVDVAEISRISMGTYGRFDLSGVILELHDGSKKSIPLGPLSEPGETIVARLREAILRT